MSFSLVLVTVGCTKYMKFTNEGLLLCSSYTIHLSSSKDIIYESFLSHPNKNYTTFKFQLPNLIQSTS